MSEGCAEQNYGNSHIILHVHHIMLQTLKETVWDVPLKHITSKFQWGESRAWECPLPYPVHLGSGLMNLKKLRGLVSKETGVLCCWGSGKEYLACQLSSKRNLTTKTRF